MTTKTIAICNQKGGTGKTTTAITLAHGLALKGRQVLLIDLDPQGQAAVSLGLRPEPGAYYFLTPRRAISSPSNNGCVRRMRTFG